jgi:hypothetical protein
MQASTGDLASNSSRSAAEPGLAQWESLMRQAVEAEREHHLALARAGYEEALRIALQLLDAPPAGRVDDCVAALVVSHHNLADLLIALGTPEDVDAATRHLCDAHETLAALYLNAQRPLSLRQAALRQTRETHVALIRHLARHGHRPLVARTLEAVDLALHGASPARH